MYHVISTGLTAIVLYLISYFFYRSGIYSLHFHRKLWNSALAITFIFTASAGVLLALQINYKWDYPFIKAILKWHAEAGVALAITGTFHLLWHLSYFLQLFKRHVKPLIKEEYRKTGSSEITANLFITGFVSSSVQLLLIREMMNISGGYELIAGTFLASWLIGSGLGAAIAGNSSLNDIRKINLIFSVSPLLSISLIVILSNLYLKTGETPSFFVGIVYTFIVLIPYCLVTGFTFVKLISIARANNNFIPGKSFSIETYGGIAAGISVTLLSSGILNTYQMVALVILLGFSFVMLVFYLEKEPFRLLFKILILIIASSFIIFMPDLFFRQLLLPGINVKETKDTPYGNITIAKYEGDRTIYYNHRLLQYSDDAMEREEDIHYAMLQSDNPKSIMLISGSINSHLPEILKYPVDKVVYVERDPALIRFEKSTYQSEFQNLIIENEDAFSYLRKSDELFDVIILLLPPPSSLLLSRFYTTDFFLTIHDRLNQDGVFMCSPGINTNYFNDESVNLYSSIYNSMSSVFNNILPVAGNKLYLIASDQSISSSFCYLTESKNISNIYVGPDFLSDDLIAVKSDEILSLINKKVPQNKSVHPVACFYYQSFNLSKTLHEKVPSIILLTVAFILPIMVIKRRNMIMYCSASALAGFEIILLFVLQLTIGNMYHLTGFILAGLMFGLAVGSGTNITVLNKHPLIWRAVVLILFYLLSGFLIDKILLLRADFLVVGIIILSAFFPALLTGNIFRELTGGKGHGSNPSSVYSADLAGSALGFILFSALAVPILGIKFSVITLSALIFVGFIFGTAKNKY
jgi:spermidine synthase